MQHRSRPVANTHVHLMKPELGLFKMPNQTTRAMDKRKAPSTSQLAVPAYPDEYPPRPLALFGALHLMF